MAELIDKGVALKLFDNCGLSMSRTFVKNRISNMPTTTETEIRAKAIDEFAEKLGRLCENSAMALDRYNGRPLYNKDGKWNDLIKDLAEQLKGEYTNPSHVRCITCKHYDGEYNVPPICYLCCKGYEDNYEER